MAQPVGLLAGRPAIEAFLSHKWSREIDFRLTKELWAFCDNSVVVRIG